ncbi:hypothetical protein [Streptomyces sp. NPDC046805]|uniref:SCO2102 family sporulation regulator n=1 Tax=Streptomyces sp. NPDC046805 TaxID=3155134 RepID=UPI0033C4FBEF
MGWTVLYIAFGIVALWLLGEVLLQYKARLRWRLLAFAGFLGVVLGVLIPSVVVIALGAAAFAVGQTYVTLSFRRGFAEGWAVNRPDGKGGFRRGRGEPDDEDAAYDDAGPVAVHDGYGDQDGPQGHENAPYGTAGGHTDDYDHEHDDVFTPARAAEPAAAMTTVYEPQPMPDDTGSYGVYADTGAYAATGDPAYATAAHGADQTYGYDYSGYGQQQYGYDTGGQQQYANYSDPYIGTQAYGGDGGYDASYGGQQYDQQGYAQDQYAAGGTWVPQQRTDEAYGGQLPQEQAYPYQGDGHQQQPGHGYDEQYRY